MRRADKIWLAILSLITIVYALLRMWNLTASCLWFDEIFSVHAATQSWRNLFWFAAQDLIHPPLFYALLKIWISLGGENLFWLRFFPVLFSILAAIPFILLCRQLKLSLSTVALALAFFTVNGSLIKYAQEVRMYSLLLCFGLFSTWLFMRFLNKGKGFFLLLIFNIFLVYTHYFGWLIVVSEILAVAILARERIKRIFLMFGIMLISFAPWIYTVRQAAKINSNIGQNIGWMTKPTVFSIFQFVFDLFEPIYFVQSNWDEPAIFPITLPILAIAAIVLGFYFANWTGETKIEKRNVLLLVIFTFTPVLAAFTASWILPYSIWGTRHLIIALAPVAILTAIAFSKIKFRKLKLASLAVIFLLFASAFLLQATRAEPNYIWCAWENLASGLPQTKSVLPQNDSDEPTKIYVFEDLVAYHFWFALRDSSRKFQVIKINGIEGLTEDKAYFLPRGFDEIISAENFEGDRFFIAFRAQDWNESAPPLQNLISQEYKISEPQIFEAQGLKAFLAEVERKDKTTGERR